MQLLFLINVSSQAPNVFSLWSEITSSVKKKLEPFCKYQCILSHAVLFFYVHLGEPTMCLHLEKTVGVVMFSKEADIPMNNQCICATILSDLPQVYSLECSQDNIWTFQRF